MAMETFFDYMDRAVTVQYIYKLGFQVCDEHIVELTADQYRSLTKQGMDANQKWYWISRGRFEPAHDHEFEIFDKDGIVKLMEAYVFLIRLAVEDGGVSGDSFKEVLEYCRGKLPEVITNPDYEAEEFDRSKITRHPGGKITISMEPEDLLNHQAREKQKAKPEGPRFKVIQGGAKT